MIYRNVCLMVVLCGLVACSTRWNQEDLKGKWRTIAWEVNSSGQRIEQQMNMSFEDQRKYHIDYGTATEKGTYYIAGEYLHTKEEGAIEKSVRILNLNPDTLIIQMNRSGSLETVLLVR